MKFLCTLLISILAVSCSSKISEEFECGCVVIDILKKQNSQLKIIECQEFPWRDELVLYYNGDIEIGDTIIFEKLKQ